MTLNCPCSKIQLRAPISNKIQFLEVQMNDCPTRFIPIVAYVRIIQKYLNLYVGVYVLKGLLSFIKRATSLSCCDINHHCWLCHQNMYLLVIICVKNSHLFALIGHFSCIIRLSMLAQVHNLVN